MNERNQGKNAITTSSELIFAEFQLPAEDESVRFWPASLVDRDSSHPGLRGYFKNARFNDAKTGVEWDSSSVFVWRPSDAEAERAAVAALQAIVSMVDVATEKCARAGLGLPAATALQAARQEVLAAMAAAA